MNLALVLPLALFLLAAEMVVGCFALLVLTDLEGEVSGPFLGRYALTFFVGGLFTAWLRSQYPSLETLQQLGVHTGWLDAERRSLLFFLIFLGLYNPATWFSLWRVRKVLGVLAVIAGAATLVYSGLAYGQTPWSGIATIANLLIAALVLGGAITGLAVGHSYLSAPQLSARPLRHLTVILIVALVAQLVSLPFYLGLFGQQSTEQAQLLQAPYVLILGLRVAIGLVFPLVLAILAWHTTRMRAMRSATGLLYIGAGVVLTGEIAAKVLFFISGIPL